MRTIILVLLVLLGSVIYGQPIIPEDRMFLKVSKDVVKLEKDIYLPGLNGEQPYHFIRWEYTYSNGLLTAERSYAARKLSVIGTEKKLVYNTDGKLIKDSCSDLSLPRLDYYTIYEYNDKGQPLKVTQLGKVKNERIRVDSYKEYKDEGNYQRVSQFFGDEGETTVQYTSVYEGGLKRKVLYKGGFAQVNYSYDSTGMLTAINNRKIFYKLDERGNPVATVAIERGRRMYDFIRLTYADGLVTGSLEPDEAFILKWDNEKL